MEKQDYENQIEHSEELPLYITAISHVHDNPSWRFGYHRATSHIDVTYIKSGSGEYAIGNSWLSVHSGDLLVIKPGVIHAIQSSQDEPLDLWILEFTNLEQAYQELHLGDVPLEHISGYRGNGEAALSIGLLIESMSHQAVQGKIQSQVNHYLALAMTNLLSDFFSKAIVLPAVDSNSVAEETVAYIDDNYSTNISLESLSRVLHVSSSSISHEMSSYYGISPISSLIDRRIGRAQWLLVSTDSSLTKIAGSVGYDNLTHFTNLFTKRVGMSPREYRDHYSETEDEVSIDSSTERGTESDIESGTESNTESSGADKTTSNAVDDGADKDDSTADDIPFTRASLTPQTPGRRPL